MAKAAVKYLHGPKSKINDIIAAGMADADDIIIAESGDGDDFITEIYYVEHTADGGIKPVAVRSLASEDVIADNLPKDEDGNVINVKDYVGDKIGDLGIDDNGNKIETVEQYVKSHLTIKEYD